MDVYNANECEAHNALPLTEVVATNVAIAISGSKKSKYIIKWALENFLSQGNICFKLLHVYPAITKVPTPLGTSMPISQVRDDVATAFRKEVEWQTNEKILPYKMLFLKRKLQIDIVKIEADDVATAIAEVVANCNIKKLIIGSSSSSIFSRGLNWSSKISEDTPSSCSVYVVSKGKLSSVRPADPGINESMRDDCSDTSRTTNSSSRYSDTSQTEQLDSGPSTESIDANSQTSKSQAPSPSRTKRHPTLITKKWTPHPQSTIYGNNHTHKIFPCRDGMEDAFNDPAITEETTDYNRPSYTDFHPSPPSHTYQVVVSKNQTPSRKSTYSGVKRTRKLRTEGEKVALCSSGVDSNRPTLNSKSPSHSPLTDMFHALSLTDQSLHRGSVMSNGSSDLNTCHDDKSAKEDTVLPHPSITGPSDVNNHFMSVGSFETANDSMSWTRDPVSTSSAPISYSSGSEAAINFELERLRLELRHMQGLYTTAQTEANDASRKLNNLQKRRLEKAIKLKEIIINEEVAKELAKQEKEKYEAAKREANHLRGCTEKEVACRKQVQVIALREVKEKKKLQNTLVSQGIHQYQIFSYEEIVTATDSFSEIHQVGMGSYGTVYKCILRHTNAAVKVFHSMSTNKMKQFQQELEVLSKIRHQHLITLLGACPEQGCLVYEYMEKGSLEERLLTRNNTPPLAWFERYRIAQEVASALAFLHSSTPKPIIHRDLKPANILLDENLVSKIGDFGLSTMVQPDSSVLQSLYEDTSPVGTLCYIDPEYQRTGQVSPQSDVYALGMVILQLLTSKQAIALPHIVEEALQEGKFEEILDSDAGEWPLVETRELAVLALKCTQIRRRDRPDLQTQIIPTLQKLRVIAACASRVMIESNYSIQFVSKKLHSNLIQAFKYQIE